MSSDSTKTRRKACLECVNAKRRCGQQLPQCLRCERRGLECQYSARRRAQLEAASVMQMNSQPDFDLQWFDGLNMVFPFALSAPSYSWGPPLNINDLLVTEAPNHLQSAEPDITQMSRQEMEFCVSQFVEYPSSWLKSGSAPFIHPSLYAAGLPSPLKAAYSAAAVYATITTENSTIAWSVIETLSESVLQCDSSLFWTTEELLARVQALCIIQIIRLFGPDIRQRHLSELSESTLALWTENLIVQTPSDRTVSAQTAQSWRSWLLAESVRRTIITSFMIRGVYALVKFGVCNIAPAVKALSFTAQKRLWDARSAMEFRRACQNKDEYWISGMEFTGLLSKATKPDIEEMGLLMSVTYYGRGFVEDWLGKEDAA